MCGSLVFDRSKMKYRFLIILLLGVALLASCSENASDEKMKNLVSLNGTTMGTELQVEYIDSSQRDLSREIDSVLIEVNNSMSTYIPNSLISIFNAMDTPGTIAVDRHFYSVLLTAKRVYRESGGAFNPALYPLIRYWGFSGGNAPEQIDSAIVDSLRSICRFDWVSGSMVIDDKGDTSYYISKKDGRVQLDFGAIAKGYGVDAVHDLIKSAGIRSIMVNIGGEIRCSGLYLDGKAWRIGIEDPKNSRVDSKKAVRIIILHNKAIATSGNYRNFHMVDGRRVAHSINPSSGYPEINEILSASVITDNCTDADAYATACMVLGLENAKKLIEGNPALEALLIYGDKNGETEYWQSSGFGQYLQK